MSAIFKSCPRTVAILCLIAAVSCGDNSGKRTYYVQLVRGSKDTQPPEPGCTAVGPKVAAQLRPVFAWTNYWEIARHEVTVSSGEKTRVRLNPHREVEIDLTTKGQRAVVAFSNGEVVSRITRPIGERMTIIGGDRDKETAWFIIVRRDKPPD